MKKRKRFYNNKKRNQKWTEEEKGRKIDFADKYIEPQNASDKFDSKRPDKNNNSVKKKAKRQKRLKNLLIAALCIAIICVGYTGMDVYMTVKERSYNPKSPSQSSNSGMVEAELRFSSLKVDSISLDSSVMLSSVIDEIEEQGYTSITFDAKRSDGTIGYASSLASVETFSALSAPSSKLKASVKELTANDILTIARVSCYKDNIAPNFLPSAAVTNDKGKLYKDEASNTYLNPKSETAYNYIKDIIQELASMGVRVFVLNDTELPEDIAKDFGGGFDALSKRLYNDIDEDIKLLEEVDVEISGKDKETGKVTKTALKNEIKALEKLDKSKVYCIFSEADKKQLTAQLERSSLTSFIIIS